MHIFFVIPSSDFIIQQFSETSVPQNHRIEQNLKHRGFRGCCLYLTCSSSLAFMRDFSEMDAFARTTLGLWRMKTVISMECVDVRIRAFFFKFGEMVSIFES